MNRPLFYTITPADEKRLIAAARKRRTERKQHAIYQRKPRPAAPTPEDRGAVAQK